MQVVCKLRFDTVGKKIPSEHTCTQINTYLLRTCWRICKRHHEGYKETKTWGPPGGTALKFARSALVARRSLVWILDADMSLLGKPCCGRHPLYKVRKMGMDVSSGPVFLSKKRRIGSN